MGYSPWGQTQLSTHSENDVTKDPLALVTGSREADQASGLAQSSRPFLSASLPCCPQADFPRGHTMALCAFSSGYASVQHSQEGL